MQYRPLGSTGLSVSRIGIGGLPIQGANDRAARQIIRAALKLGVNFLDTARSYSDSEAKYGKALRGVRSRFIIASKSASRTAKGVRRDLTRSLRALRTDYIDIYQLHNVASADSLRKVLAPGGALSGLQEAQQEGLIRYIGVTSHHPETLRVALQTGAFSTIQAPVNAVEHQFLDILRAAKAKGVGTIAMKPLAGGSFRRPDLALRYLLAEQAIDVIIPGVMNVKQLRQNSGLVDQPTLREAEVRLLQQDVASLGQHFCRRCGYCLPCPQGVRIPTIFLLEGYVERYGLTKWARRRYAAMRRKASSCKQCGLCERRCPYHLPIRQKLKAAHTRLI